MSAGTEVLAAGLKQIDQEEGVGIIEELNELKSHEEQEFNELLTGIGESKGRCLLLASKNPAGTKNNTSLSEATLSRLQKMIVHEPPQEALLRISERALGDSLGKKMTAAFCRFKQDHGATTTRHFFQMLAFKKSTGKEKQFLLRKIFVQALKNYRASLHSPTVFMGRISQEKMEKEAIDALIAAYKGPVDFTEAQVKVIRGLTGSVASLVRQFVAEGGELPGSFLAQEIEKTEPDWDNMTFSC